MIAKYKFKKFEFHTFQNFIWDLINLYQIGQIRFTPHQGINLFNDRQLTHIGPVYNLNNQGDFLYVWSRHQDIIKIVTFEQFHISGIPRYKATFDLEERIIFIESAEGITLKSIEESLKRFFVIYDVAGVNKWWKYTHPVWWVLQITRLPFFLIKEAGFNIGKVESSVFGKLIRWIIGAIVVFGGAILPILDAFGYKDGFVNFVKNAFRL